MVKDWDLTWYSDQFPDFTLCFEETVLVWVPCLILMVLSFIELPLFMSGKNTEKPFPYTIFSVIKIVRILMFKVIKIIYLTLFTVFDYIFGHFKFGRTFSKNNSTNKCISIGIYGGKFHPDHQILHICKY